MRIIDCFPYFNEKELLELRIKLLYDKVDKFIIIDANKTHKGDFKNFTCKKTLESLGLLSSKVQVIELDLPSYEEEPNAWVRERMQRNVAANFIENDDIFIISDCDEIINPDLIDYYVSIASQYSNNILRIPMAFLNSRADLRVYDSNNQPIPWGAAFLCMKHHLQKYTPSDIRESYAVSTNHIEFPDIFITENNKIEDAGWHFSWMGDSDRLKIKNKSFLHWDEVSVQENYIPKENSTDCLGREDHILKHYSTKNLPTKIWELPRVKQFLLNRHSFFYLDKEKILRGVGQNNFFNWEGHRAFAEWIVRKLNPKTIVDLGVDYGYSSFCFSLPNIGNVYGIDSFEGDNHAGKRDTYEYVLSKKKELELDNLTIIKGYFDDVVKTWDKQIDILHIDGLHTYEAVKNDFETWIRFLNPNGIILMHDTMVDNPDFGVSKFFKEINLPKTNFKNSNGLGIVSYNQNIIDIIKQNFSELIFEFDDEPRNKSVIQVGTNRANDSLSRYLLSKFENLELGVFVEPNSYFNEEIKKCYSKYDNIFIENVAILPEKIEEIVMYYHTGDPTFETASCKLDHILKHQQFYSEGEIKAFSVPCMTLKELFLKYNVNELDWLLLDIEGIDAEIILSFDWENYNIKRVEFEHLHLGEYKDMIEQKFYNLGYKKVNSLHEFDWAFEK